MLSENTREDCAELIKNRTKGAIYGQAILDAIGLTTEFLGTNQAKILLRDAGVLTVSDDHQFSTSITPENRKTFQADPYIIRETKALYLSNAINGQKNAEGTATFGDARSTGENPWRQSVSRGSFTDDTDQAILKFKALQESEGDLNKAKEIYANHILGWSKGQLRDAFGKPPFGLGGNTEDVIKDPGFLTDPEETSQRIWKKTITEQFFFPQANGALMSSSYVLQYYPDDLAKAQEATIELAKVTHYDPLVSAHCVAYITMLYHLQHHRSEEIDDSKYQEYLDASFKAGEKVFNERVQEYDQFRTSHIWGGEGVMDRKIAEWREQMQKAIYGEITKADGTKDEFKKWEELDLTNPSGSKTVLKDFQYDNIGMSHRALSAGFYGLKKLRQKIKSGSSKQDAFAEIAIELTAQGGDADTNGTIVGALCGSYVGFSEISEGMVKDLGNASSDQKEVKLLEEIIQISNQKIDASFTKITPEITFTDDELEPDKIARPPEKPSENLPEKPPEKPSENLPEKPSENLPEKPLGKPLENLPEKPPKKPLGKPLENPLLYLEIIGDSSPRKEPEKTEGTNNNALLIGLIAGGTIGAGASLLCVSALAISVVSVPAIAIVATSVVVGAGIGIAIANNSCKSSSASQISPQTTQQIPG